MQKWIISAVILILFSLSIIQSTKQPDSIHVFPSDDANIYFAVDTTRVLYPDDCVTLTWNIYNVDNIRLNTFERSPDGQEQWCGKSPILFVTLSNGEIFTHQFEFQSILPIERMLFRYTALAFLSVFILFQIRHSLAPVFISTHNWIQQNQTFVILLLFISIARYFMAAYNSYWVDELLSVKIYGTDHKNAVDMINALALNSLHPPLYQTILYYWMSIFGSTEIDTRMLSTLYVAGATIFIYLTTLRLYSRRTALFASITFNLTFLTMYYSLETRSYAQTLFLSTASTYFLFRYLEKNWQSIRRNRWLLWMLLCNIGLILTHYYNIVFLMTQGIFFFAYFYHKSDFKRLKQNLYRTAITYFIPIFALLILWFPGLTIHFNREHNRYPEGKEAVNPLIVLDRLFSLNIKYADFIYILGIMTVGLVLFYSRKSWMRLSFKQYGYVYFLWMFIGLPIISITMTLIGRFNARYMIYYIPIMMIFVVITFEQGIGIFDRVTQYRFRLSRYYLKYAFSIMLFISIVFVLPTGYEAATTQKDEWRDVARQIVNVIEQDSEHSYVIYETSFGARYIDHYLDRFSNNINTHRSISLSYEDENNNFNIFVHDEQIINQHDFIIVTFVQPRYHKFPRTISEFCNTFTYKSHTISQIGYGYIIFEVHGNKPNTCPPFLTQSGD